MATPAGDAEKIACLLDETPRDLSWDVWRMPESVTRGGKLQVEEKQKPVSQAELSSAIHDLLYREPVPEVALLFFAGHGICRENEGFLAASDTRVDAQEEDQKGISFSWLRTELSKSPVTKQIVWLDCCYSGQLLNFTEAELKEWHLRGDRSLIAACQRDRVAHAWSEGGVLTKELVKALDPESHREGKEINTGTVTDFIEERKTQNPFLKRQIPLCKNFGERIRLWEGKNKSQGLPLDPELSELANILNYIRELMSERGQYDTNESLDNAVTEAMKRVKIFLPKLKANTNEPYLIITEIIRLTLPDYFLLEEVLEKVCDPEVQIPDGDKSEWLESIVRSLQMFKELLQVWTVAYEKAIVETNDPLAKKVIDKAFCESVEDWTDRLKSLGHIEEIRLRDFDTIKSCVEHHIENLKKGGMWTDETIPTIDPTNDGENVFRVTVSNCAYKEGCKWGLDVPEFQENGKYRCQRLGSFIGAVKKYMNRDNLSEEQIEKLDYLMTIVMDETQGCQGLLFINDNFMRGELLQKYLTQFPAS